MSPDPISLPDRESNTLPSGDGRRSRGNSGLTLIEVMFAIVVVSILMLATTAAFTSTMKGMRHADATTRASIFLQSTMEDLSAQSYAALLAMNGNTFYDDGVEADSNYEIDLAVFQSAVGLLQVSVSLSVVGDDRELARITTLRSLN